MRTSLENLLHEISRLRRLKPIPTDREGVIQHLRSELDELSRETSGSKEAQEEVADALAICIHLCCIEGVEVEVAETMQSEKLRARLNLVEKGYSWELAKVILQSAQKTVVAAWNLRRGDHFSWLGSFGVYKALEDPKTDQEFPSRLTIRCSRNGREMTTRLKALTPCTVFPSEKDSD